MGRFFYLWPGELLRCHFQTAMPNSNLDIYSTLENKVIPGYEDHPIIVEIRVHKIRE
jgi:hypothetical protein